MRSPLGHALRSKEEPFILGICGNSEAMKRRIKIAEDILKQFQHYESPLSYTVIDLHSSNPYLDIQLEQLLDIHKMLKTRVFLVGYPRFRGFPSGIRERLTHVLMMQSAHLGKFYRIDKDRRDPSKRYIKALSIEGFLQKSRDKSRSLYGSRFKKHKE